MYVRAREESVTEKKEIKTRKSKKNETPCEPQSDAVLVDPVNCSFRFPTLPKYLRWVAKPPSLALTTPGTLAGPSPLDLWAAALVVSEAA